MSRDFIAFQCDLSVVSEFVFFTGGCNSYRSKCTKKYVFLKRFAHCGLEGCGGGGYLKIILRVLTKTSLKSGNNVKH